MFNLLKIQLVEKRVSLNRKCTLEGNFPSYKERVRNGYEILHTGDTCALDTAHLASSELRGVKWCGVEWSVVSEGQWRGPNMCAT